MMSKENSQNIGIHMIMGTSMEVCKIGIRRFADNNRVAIDISVCTMGTAVRKRTAESSIIGKAVNWIG